jgi:hypothetical protein
LEIEIADRKRTLSKYLNQKQVDKFIEMQNEYGSKNKATENKLKYEQRYTPQAHQLLQSPQSRQSNNEYELNRL